MTMRPLLLTLFTFLAMGIYAQIESSVLSPLPDQGRDDAVGFSMDGIGYIVGGRKTDFGISNDLWAYNPELDLWSIRSPFPGNPRQYASSFILDGWAYLFCGLADPGVRLNELWRYSPISNTWEQRADFPGGVRFAPISFVLNGIAYAGLGKGDDTYYKDLWRYEPDSDSWELAVQLPIALYSAISFDIEGHQILGLGLDDQEEYNARVWSFDGINLTEQSAAPFGLGFADAVSLGTQAIVIGGRAESIEARDGIFIANNVWNLNQPMRLDWEEQVPIADGAKRNGAVFQIAKRGYYFGGKDELGIKSNALVEFTLNESEGAISVFPNPSFGALIIQSSTPFQLLKIYNLQGRLLVSRSQGEPITELRLDLTGIASGVYQLQVDKRAGRQIVVLD
jgi:hypothetical protein